VLSENTSIAFMGDTKGGPFDISGDLARHMLAAGGNPNGRPNSDVVRPWANGLDITRRPRDMWIIDFGTDMSLEDAALYEAPFEYVNEHVRPMRATNNRKVYRELWWLYVEPRPAMRQALTGLQRFMGTARVAKHRLFAWLEAETLLDSQIIIFARDDDYFFGVLHSWAHEVWARRMGTQLREAESGFRYTPTTCFETFPFPESSSTQRVEITEAVRRLDELRRNWLNPDEASEAELKKRTLTNLYNERPTWLQNAHDKLDKAVFAAYGWPEDIADEEILKNLLTLNLERS
jgi:type II restriction/modification system DNA methylase subunit YeeA